MGSAGLSVPPRMATLIARAGDGFLSSFKGGGQELRKIYQECTLEFNPLLLNPFAMMCYFGHLEGVMKAVKNGEAPQLSNTETPFRFGYATLVASGSQRISQHGGGPKPLHAATLKFLLMSGCPPDVEDICRYTALAHASTIPQDNADVARILIQHGADVNHQDILGMVAVSGAIMAAHSKAVDVLMEGGASLDIKDGDQWVPRKISDKAGPKVAAVIRKWERRRAGEQALLGEQGCSVCGKEDKQRFCAACYVVRYCSPECQKENWKEHKKTCKPFSPTNTLTFKPRFDDQHQILVPMQDIARLVTGFRPAASERRQRVFNLPSEFPKKMIIKVQISPTSSTMPSLVYDSKRQLACQLNREDSPEVFDRMTEIVRTKGFSGLKAYFAADLRNEDELVIKVDDILGEQPF
ncbi:ankyrin [Gloeopeniophorella convolvens]|nr:ankyrin [Gloeopeniophorella convolvens]